jgi:hypothetical protein
LAVAFDKIAGCFSYSAYRKVVFRHTGKAQQAYSPQEREKFSLYCSDFFYFRHMDLPI